MSRIDWDEYMMRIAYEVSARSTCDRKAVGCVLTRDRRLLATGYNGSLPGAPHCDEAGHDLVESIGEGGKVVLNCVRTVHAEVNAIAQAALHGIATKGSVAYVNTYPCWPCFKVLMSAGVYAVVYDSEYKPDPRVAAEVERSRIVVRKVVEVGE